MKQQVVDTFINMPNLVQPEWTSCFFLEYERQRHMRWLLSNSWTGYGRRRYKIKSIIERSAKKQIRILRKAYHLQKGQLTDMRYLVKQIQSGRNYEALLIVYRDLPE